MPTPDFPLDANLMDYGPILASACGDNAMNWARAFCATARTLGLDIGPDPEGWMVGWFANAIEASWDARTIPQQPAFPPLTLVR